jgi:hypothetical protein
LRERERERMKRERKKNSTLLTIDNRCVFAKRRYSFSVYKFEVLSHNITALKDKLNNLVL